jgi:predicted DNA binding CopG/RHH family protein
MKKISKKRQIALDEMLAEDGDAWDNRQLGADPKHAHAAPEYAKTGASTVTTIRMPIRMVKDLKLIAEREGLPYQSLIKSVLTKYIRDKKSA